MACTAGPADVGLDAHQPFAYSNSVVIVGDSSSDSIPSAKSKTCVLSQHEIASAMRRAGDLNAEKTAAWLVANMVNTWEDMVHAPWSELAPPEHITPVVRNKILRVGLEGVWLCVYG